MENRENGMNIVDALKDVAERICDGYCKWPEACSEGDEDAAMDALNEHCDSCPLNQFFF